MILDSFENASRYLSLNKGFSKAFEFLSRADMASLAEGKYEIDADRVFATVSKGMGRPKEEALLEVHRKYIDIQWVIGGTDTMGWKPLQECKEPAGEYNLSKDIQFFNDTPNAWIATESGSFVIFFPEDAHMPLISSGEIHKVVVKILETEDGF